MKIISINNAVFKCQIWDTSGQEQFKHIAKNYIKSAHLILLCFDPTNYSSWEKIHSWVRSVNDYCQNNTWKILVSTRSDCKDEYKVDPKIPLNYASTECLPYFECSAKTGDGIEELFQFAALLSIERYPTQLSPKDSREKIYQNVRAELMKNKSHQEGIKKLQAVSIARTEILTKIRTLAKEKSLTLADAYHEIMKQSDIIAPMTESKKSPLEQATDSLPMTTPHTTKTLLLEEKKAEVTLTTTPPIELVLTDSESEPTPVKPDELKVKQPPPSNEMLLSALQPLISIDNDDEQSIIEALQLLPSTVIEDSLLPWEDDWHDFQQHLLDAKTPVSGQKIVKQLCFSLQYQHRASRIQAKPETTLSPAQAYIEAHPALQEYHDLFLQTLEFGIKAALLGVTGRLSMNNTTGTVLSTMSGVAEAIPLIGGTLKTPIAALEFANKIKMRHQDGQISQLFKGARDIEAQVAELAEQMTLAIREELLTGKRTSQRQRAHEKGGLGGFYQRNKTWLSQQKTEWLNWKTLTPAQQQALVDVDYLLTELPTLVTGKFHRQTRAGVPAYLKILMHDLHFHYDAEATLAALDRIVEHKSDDHSFQTAYSTAVTTKKHHFYSRKRETCLITLHTQCQQSLTSSHWSSLLTTLSGLEDTLSELSASEDIADDLSQTLTQWFDRLQQTATTTDYTTTVKPDAKLIPQPIVSSSAGSCASSPSQSTASTVSSPAKPNASSVSASQTSSLSFYEELLRATWLLWDVENTEWESQPEESKPKKLTTSEALQKAASEYGYDCKNMHKDGNCFYHAVSHQFKQQMGIDIPYDKLRAEAVQHVLDHLSLYSPATEGSMHTFIDKMSQDKQWADNIHLIALSRALNITLVIVRSDGEPPTVYRRSNPHATIYLGYEVGLHYQSLLLRKPELSAALKKHIETSTADTHCLKSISLDMLKAFGTPVSSPVPSSTTTSLTSTTSSLSSQDEKTSITTPSTFTPAIPSTPIKPKDQLQSPPGSASPAGLLPTPHILKNVKPTNPINERVEFNP